VLGSLNFGQISIDQILLLKRCDFYEKNYLTVTAMKMMHAYNQVSDEFGFNPQGDRESVMVGLNQIKDKIIQSRLEKPMSETNVNESQSYLPIAMMKSRQSLGSHT
jgi:hypothetical protein